MDNGGMPKDWTPPKDSWVDRNAKIAKLEKHNKELEVLIKGAIKSIGEYQEDNLRLRKALENLKILSVKGEEAYDIIDEALKEVAK